MNQFIQHNIGSQSELRRLNRNRVFRFLFSCDLAQSRQSIAQHTGINFPTISRITSEMIKGGLIEEVKSETYGAGRGRKSHKVQIKSNGGFVICFVLSAYTQKIMIGNLSGHIVFVLNIEEVFTFSAKNVGDFLISAIHNMIQASGIDTNKIIGGCITAPPHMILSDSNIVGSVVSKKIIELLQNELHVPFFGTRISNTLNVAEYKLGVSKDEKNVLYSHLSLNIGSSIIYDGSLFSETNRVGMISCMPVPHIKSVDCNIPRLHTHASGMAVLAQLGHTRSKNLSYTIEDCHNLELSLSEAQSEGTVACHCFMEAGKCMGYALEILCSVFNPDVIVLGGSLTKSTPYMNELWATWKANATDRKFPVDIRVGSIDIVTATVITALDGHLNSEHINLAALL